MAGLKGVSTKAATHNAISPVRMLVILAVCRATGCWQQECEAGITDDSHSCAIFLQQLCSSAVICLSGTMQAMTGVATTAMISRTAANWDSLHNISILPSRANSQENLEQPSQAAQSKAPLLLLLCCFSHIFMQRRESFGFLGLFQIQLSPVM